MSTVAPSATRPGTPGDLSPRWMAAAFVGGILGLGMLRAGLSFAAQPAAVGAHDPHSYPPLYPPDWAFWAVWPVIYPCWGAPPGSSGVGAARRIYAVSGVTSP